MCGRFVLFTDGQVLTEQFDAPLPTDLIPRFNIAPTQNIPVVRTSDDGEREIAFLRWGLIPSWAKDPAVGNRLINARSETAWDKPSFRAVFKRHRCLIPANGFYEWQKKERTKQPFFIKMRDERLFAFAGMWDRWRSAAGDAVETCAILTTAANGVLAPIHDRMPVILPASVYEHWLNPEITDPGVLVPLLSPFPDDEMVAYPVSSRVNSPSHDDKDCTAPLQ
ncbi:MAG: SOS response-associated peptidase [Thermodesulfobacteriota bacterium]